MRHYIRFELFGEVIEFIFHNSSDFTDEAITKSLDAIRQAIREFISYKKPNIIIDAILVSKNKSLSREVITHDAMIYYLKLYDFYHVVKIRDVENNNLILMDSDLGLTNGRFNISKNKGRVEFFYDPFYFDLFFKGILKIILPKIAIKQDVVFFHSASFFRNNKGFLIIGFSEAGKSTLCKENPDMYGSDEYNFISKEGDHFRLSSSVFFSSVYPFLKEARLKRIAILNRAIPFELNKKTPFRDVFSILKDNCLMGGFSFDEKKRAFGIVSELIKKIPLKFVRRKLFDPVEDVIG